MSDFLDNVGTYLDAENVGVYDVATSRNIFVGVLPPDPDTAIAILGSLGPNPGDSRDVPTLYFTRFQVVIRSATYETAATNLRAVRTALHGLINESFTNYRVLRCHAEQDGGYIGQDDQGRHEFSISFTTEYHAT